MKYFKWQEIHRHRYVARPVKSYEMNNFNTDGLNEAQKAAWQELQKYWRPKELARLLTLAKTYDAASDTFKFEIKDNAIE